MRVKKNFFRFTTYPPRSIRSVPQFLAIGIYSRLLSSKLPNTVLVLTQGEQCQLRGARAEFGSDAGGEPDHLNVLHHADLAVPAIC